MENKNTQTTLLIGRDNNDGTVVYVSTTRPKLVGPDGAEATKDNIEQCSIEFDQGRKVDALRYSGTTIMSDDEVFWSMKIKDHKILPHTGGEFKAVFKLPKGDDVSNYSKIGDITCYAHIENVDGSYDTIKCNNATSDSNDELSYVFFVDEWKRSIDSSKVAEYIERVYGDLSEQERKDIYDKLYNSATERTIAFDLVLESIDRHPVKLHSSSVKQKSSITTTPSETIQLAKYITLTSGEGFIFE